MGTLCGMSHRLPFKATMEQKHAGGNCTAEKQRAILEGSIVTHHALIDDDFYPLDAHASACSGPSMHTCKGEKLSCARRRCNPRLLTQLGLPLVRLYAEPSAEIKRKATLRVGPYAFLGFEYLDLIVYNLLLKHVPDRSTPPTYFEAGAADGLFGSNTWFLESLGWQGVLVEPDPCGLCSLPRNRPRARVVQAGLCPRPTHIPSPAAFFEQCGTDFAVAQKAHLQCIHNASQRKRVPCRPLTDILAELGVWRVDFLSLDVTCQGSHRTARMPFIAQIHIFKPRSLKQTLQSQRSLSLSLSLAHVCTCQHVQLNMSTCSTCQHVTCTCTCHKHVHVQHT
jgi:hypothetical protein